MAADLTDPGLVWSLRGNWSIVHCYHQIEVYFVFNWNLLITYDLFKIILPSLAYGKCLYYQLKWVIIQGFSHLSKMLDIFYLLSWWLLTVWDYNHFLLNVVILCTNIVFTLKLNLMTAFLLHMCVASCNMWPVKPLEWYDWNHLTHSNGFLWSHACQVPTWSTSCTIVHRTVGYST